MRGFFTMLGKLFAESRWNLFISAGAMFLFGWLNTYVISLRIAQIQEQLAKADPDRFRMVREMAGDARDVSLAMIEMAFWMHPFVWLPVVVWAIGRASLAVAGELERGTLDLVLSRPLSRWSYLFAQIFYAWFGLVVLAIALVAGNRLATIAYPIEQAPIVRLLFWPAWNLVLLGAAIHGLTLAISSADRVRWRATLLGTVIATAGFAAWLIANLKDMASSPLRPWLKAIALFELFNPIDAVGKAERLAFNLSFLSGLTLIGVILAFLAFLWRDLPANG